MAALLLMVNMVLAPGPPPAAIVAFSAKNSEVVVERHPERGEIRRERQEIIYRDSRGRMRYEFVEEDPAGPVRIGFLYERGSMRTVVIDLETGQEMRTAGGGVPRLPSTGRLTGGPPEVVTSARREALGERTIEGLHCRGSRWHAPNGDVTESWTADALPDVPIISLATTRAGYSEYRLSDIRIGEPPPELFAPLDTRPQR